METVGRKPTRKCIDCELESENLNLFVTSSVSKFNKRNLCISCAVKRNNSHAKHKDWKTDHQTRKRYGIDLETYRKHMASSDCCQICNKKETLCYDHDHNTMLFRGVLCRSCNSAIGHLGDSVEGLQKALNYLKGTH